MKGIITTAFIVLIFNGCIVKQTANQKQPNNAYNLSDPYNVPGMTPQTIYNKTPQAKQQFTYPNKQTSDTQLQSLLEGNLAQKPKSVENDKLDISKVPISNAKDEIEITQKKDEITIPKIAKVEVIDTTKDEKNVEKLDKNVIKAQMHGLYGEFAYPVSIRKTHHFRDKNKKDKNNNNSIQTQPLAPQPKHSKITTPKPAPKITSEASIDISKDLKINNTKKTATTSKKPTLSKQSTQGTL